MKILIYGAQGTMGSLAYQEGVKAGHQMIAVDPLATDAHIIKSLDLIANQVDAIIDFSHPNQLDILLSYAMKSHTPLVIATTGYDDEAANKIKEASNVIAIFKSANLSYGIHILKQILKQYAPLLKKDYDIEIIEKHHKYKKDAPSGTALYLADTINKACNHEMHFISNRYDALVKREQQEIGIQSIRGGHIVGEHTIIFAGDEDILEFTHKAQSKAMFVKGALKAAEFILNQQKGLYGMDDLPIEGMK